MTRRRQARIASYATLLALPAPALNNTWEWLAADLTLVTPPGAGHFVQQDAAELVTRSMRMWLQR
jgi:pimeloyl-ACP methyl ester carboxylesterase